MANAEAKSVLQGQILQSYQLTRLTRYPYRIAIYSSTGSGKSKAALECATYYNDEIARSRRDKNLIACHSVTARDIDWPEQLRTWIKDEDYNQYERVCYKSLGKFKNQHFPVVILDEAHKLTENNFREFKANNTVGSWIILTATEPRDYYKKQMIRELVNGNQFILPVDDAVDKGITNDYRINLFELEFDRLDPYVEIEGKGIFNEYSAYLQYCKKIQEARWTNNSNRIKFAYIALMRFMAGTKSKERAAKYIIDRFRKNNRRFIVFAHSIAQANALSPYRLHSETTDEDYIAFKEGHINELASIRQIQEGANIPNLLKALLIQIDSNPLNIIQKNGRLLRGEVGETADMNILVFKDCYDDVWATKALKKFDKTKIIRRPLSKELYWDTYGL